MPDSFSVDWAKTDSELLAEFRIYLKKRKRLADHSPSGRVEVPKDLLEALGIYRLSKKAKEKSGKQEAILEIAPDLGSETNVNISRSKLRYKTFLSKQIKKLKTMMK